MVTYTYNYTSKNNLERFIIDLIEGQVTLNSFYLTVTKDQYLGTFYFSPGAANDNIIPLNELVDEMVDEIDGTGIQKLCLIKHPKIPDMTVLVSLYSRYNKEYVP